jgi:hypothetical protein
VLECAGECQKQPPARHKAGIACKHHVHALYRGDLHCVRVACSVSAQIARILSFDKIKRLIYRANVTAECGFRDPPFDPSGMAKSLPNDSAVLTSI